MRRGRRAGDDRLHGAAAEEGGAHVGERGVYREVIDVRAGVSDTARYLPEADVGSDVEAGEGEAADEDLRILPDLPFDISQREPFAALVHAEVLRLDFSIFFHDIEDYRRRDDGDDDRLREVEGDEPGGEGDRH